MLICDTHVDTLYAMQDGTRAADAPLHVTRERLTGNAADTRVQAMALWTGTEGLLGKDMGLINREMESLDSLLAQGFRQVHRLEDALPGVPNILLTIEGGEVFEGGLQTVDAFAVWGVRIAGLVWNNENSFAKPAVSGSDKGLTAPGRKLVARLNEQHIAVDVSHLNIAGVRDALRLSRAPIIASHSCARALCDHPRNLTDDQLKAIFDMGGYVGVNFYPVFLSTEGKATLDTVIDHVEHMMALGGAKQVGMGSDFDGIEATPDGLAHAGDVYALFARMRERGFAEEAVADFAGENLRRYLAKI